MNVRTEAACMPDPINYCISRTQRLLPKLVAAAGLLALLPTLSAAQLPPPTAPSAAAAPTASAVSLAKPAALAIADFRDPASGVEIYTNIDRGMFPDSWLTPEIAADAQSLSSTERERALRLMKIALSKYPADVLRQNIERIYVVGDLKFDGIQAAGTNSRDRLYIKIEAGNTLYTDAFIEESVHHEFGHMLQRNYQYLWEDDSWTRCNPPDFHYGAGEGGVQAVRAGHSSLHISDSWNRRGFLSEYAASDASEDFATVAGAILGSEPAFWLSLDRYPALKTKIDVAIAFYGKIDPSFNSAFFQSLRPGVAYVPPAAPASATAAAPPATSTVTPPNVTPPTTDPPLPEKPAAKP